VAESGVRPEQQEQVGEAGDGDAEVCPDATTAPAVVELGSVTAESFGGLRSAGFIAPATGDA